MIPPIYIPSKGRAEIERRLTARYFDSIGIDYLLVIEPQEYDYYRENGVDKKKLLCMDLTYKEKYDLLDDFGTDNMGTGAGPARNFIWDHSIASGHDYHWTMDDNIRSFYRFHKNRRIRVSDRAIFFAMEDFCKRYKNIAMAGPQYFMFCPSRDVYPPFVANRRIYSCNFIRNDVPFRWRGRYNEDTILSLDMLKAGWCTVLFNAFLQQKTPTQIMKGGNTEEIYVPEDRAKGEKYSKTGTVAKSQMLVDAHPDVSKVVFRFGRVHHHVDYRPFKRNKLLRREDYDVEKTPNNYGMGLHRKGEGNGKTGATK